MFVRLRQAMLTHSNCIRAGACATALAALAVARLVHLRRRVLYRNQSHRSSHTATCKALPSSPRAPKGQGNQDPRFFAARDADGNLAINPRLLDTFLRWNCGRVLLEMGLFPNVQEITESMACVEAIREQLGGVVSLAAADVCAVVICAVASRVDRPGLARSSVSADRQG